MMTTSLRKRLQFATHDVHEALHAHPDFAAMQDGSISVQAFDHVMARMGGFYRALDPIMTAASRSFSDGTYRYLPRSPMFSDVEKPQMTLPSITSQPSLAGAAYVVDGSVLGGRVLGTALGGRLHHAYWAWCASEGPQVWRNVLAFIDHVDTGSAQQTQAIDAALAVFETFKESVTEQQGEAVS